MFPSSGSYYKKLLTYQNQLFYLRTYSFSFWLIINFITEAKCFLPAVVIIKNSRHIKFNCFKSYRRTMNLLATIRLSNTGVYLQMYHLVLEFYYCAWFAKKKKKKKSTIFLNVFGLPSVKEQNELRELPEPHSEVIKTSKMELFVKTLTSESR